MLFVYALERLKMGAAMRRKGWTEEDGYIALMPGMKYVWKIVLLPNPNAGNFIFSVEDFTANDWEELPEALEEIAEEAA